MVTDTLMALLVFCGASDSAWPDWRELLLQVHSSCPVFGNRLDCQGPNFSGDCVYSTICHIVSVLAGNAFVCLSPPLFFTEFTSFNFHWTVYLCLCQISSRLLRREDNCILGYPVDHSVVGVCFFVSPESETDDLKVQSVIVIPYSPGSVNGKQTFINTNWCLPISLVFQDHWREGCHLFGFLSSNIDNLSRN